MEGNAAARGAPEALYIIDYGTKTLPVGAQIRHARQQPAPGRTSILRLQDQPGTESPQLVGYVSRNGALEFVWGYELSKLRQHSKQNTSKVVAVFERLKLAILGTSEESVVVRRSIEDGLKRLDVPEKTAEDLFVRHLIALRPAISAAVSKEFASLRNNRSAQQLNKMPVHVFFAAPEIAELDKLHNLSKLLKRAGFPETTLIPEAEAAGAWHAFRFCHEMLDPRISDETFAVGTGLVVCDIGGWTCNISSFTLSGSAAKGARMGMKSTGRMASLPLGSEMVNFKLLDYIKEDLIATFKDLPTALAELGVTEDALDYDLNKHFESFKLGFQEEGTRAMEVRGIETGDYYQKCGQIPAFSYEITDDQVSGWIDDLASDMIPAIERISSPTSRILTMTGGFSLNTYLIEVLRKHFEPLGLTVITPGGGPYRNADLAVVNGAPARFDANAPKRPFPYALGMSQDETYDPEQHPDMDTDSRGTIPDPDDPENEEREWVEGRYVEILPRGKLMINSSGSYVRWLTRDVQEAAFDYEKEIFFTSAKVLEHAPTRPDGHLRTDLKVYDTIKASFSVEDVMEMPLKEVEYDSSQAQVASKPPTKGVARSSIRTKAMMEKSQGRSGLQVEQDESPEHQLFLKVTTMLNGMTVSVKLERPRPGCDVYVEIYKDNGEVVSQRDKQALSNSAKGRERVWIFRDPPQKDMIHVTSTSLLSDKHWPQLQREEGVDEATAANTERRDSVLQSIEDDDADEYRPTTKRTRKR